jgi:hypothetical protein
MSAGASSYYYNTYPATTTTTTTADVSGTTLVLVLVCAVVGLGLLYWASQFCLMYCYYKNDAGDRPNYIYGSNENNCNDLCCIYTNKSIIRHFCPELLAHDGKEDPAMFIKMPPPTTVVGVVTARGYVALPRIERMPCIHEEMA